MSGSDVMAQSNTGTGRHYSLLLCMHSTSLGKTLAYAIPIVHCLREAKPMISRSQGLHAIVIVPTREVCKHVLTKYIFYSFLACLASLSSV